MPTSISHIDQMHLQPFPKNLDKFTTKYNQNYDDTVLIFLCFI